jgi:hypothetical protein
VLGCTAPKPQSPREIKTGDSAGTERKMQTEKRMRVTDKKKMQTAGMENLIEWLVIMNVRMVIVTARMKVLITGMEILNFEREILTFRIKR